MAGIRAVVADDSHFMRTTIEKILENNDIDVVATAGDGREAVTAVQEYDPDVVTMDVEMPRMDGLEAVGEIMERHPTPILMLSAHTDEKADVTFEALERGAIDFFTKPRENVTTEIHGVTDDLVGKVRSVAESDVSSVTGSAAGADADAPAAPVGGDAGLAEEFGVEYRPNPVLIIGASTGGPPVVERILAELPRDADFRILVVQHMVDEFTARFAERLDGASEYEVREAQDGDRISGGEALVARGGYHMTVAGYARGRLRVKLTEDEPMHGVRPAVDATLLSAAETIGSDTHVTAAILTGMGTDGQRGVPAIRKCGGRTVAQDEETSAAYGMPKVAVETGCVDSVLPEEELVPGILNTISEPP